MNPAIRYFLLGLGTAVLSCQISGCGLLRYAADPPRQAPAPLFEADPVRYKVEIKTEDLPADASAGELRSAMEKHSQLVLLKDKLPDGMLGLSRRARSDEQNAVKLLHSLGFYEGRADALVTEPAESGGSALAVLTLYAGPRYKIGKVHLVYRPSPSPLPAFFGVKAVPIPQKLEGVESGQPAKAEVLLAAVADLPEKMRRAGYPEASVASTRYTLDRAAKTLNAEVVVDPGLAAVMGAIRISGSKAVDTDYLMKLIPWQEGQPWDSRLLMKYREELQRTGLFRRVDVQPAAISSVTGPTKSDVGASREVKPATSSEVSLPTVTDQSIVELPTLVELQDSRFRSIGASARYSTDVGMGVQGEWQHRNLFGAGEKLTLKAPFAQDKRGVQADFEKPCFGHKDQKLLAGASYLDEETDAYDTKAQNAYIGLERRLSPTWWASVKLFGETGTVTREDDEDYRYGSVILNVRRDTRDSILNPTSGTFLQWEAAPTGGYYDGNFSGVLGKMTASAYYKPFDSDWLVLAGRLSFGTFWGADLNNIPPTLRFYCGGGGSVRGYSYQAIGPKDRYGDPMGGRSFQEVNLEARFRVTKDIGIVPFLDGGMVYDEEYPKFFQDFQWGAGLGLRYYTPIGPIRLDVAVPLDKKEDDRGWQLYISIGQAF